MLVESMHLVRAYSVAAELGIADLVHERPRTVAELAEATQTNRDSLFRMLRVLAAFGVFREDRHERFHMTRRARVLLSENPASFRWWLMFLGRPEVWQCFGQSIESVRTGVPEFKVAALPTGLLRSYLTTHPELSGRAFVKAMSGWTEWHRRELVRTYDFGRFHTVMDVGGGMGSLLEHILASNPAAARDSC